MQMARGCRASVGPSKLAKNNNQVLPGAGGYLHACLECVTGVHPYQSRHFFTMPWNSSPAFSAIDPARARLGRYIKAGVGPTGALVGATSSIHPSTSSTPEFHSFEPKHIIMVAFNALLVAISAAVGAFASPTNATAPGSLLARAGTPSSTGTHNGFYYSVRRWNTPSPLFILNMRVNLSSGRTVVVLSTTAMVRFKLHCLQGILTRRFSQVTQAPIAFRGKTATTLWVERAGKPGQPIGEFRLACLWLVPLPPTLS